MTKIKLNVLLAKTDHLAGVYKNFIADYVGFFKKNQGQFKGERKTYEPGQGTIDIPGNRAIKLIVTTVDEKLEYLTSSNEDYINSLFSQEATNASGVAKTNLTVLGENFGDYSSLELLRLKSLLENGHFTELYNEIPVRNDDEQWISTEDTAFKRNGIFEGKLSSGDQKSMVKEAYILADPNIGSIKNADSYKPQLSTKDTIITLGSYTHQRFSGEWSQRQRAELLNRKSKLLTAVIEALKVANDVEAVDSQMNSKKLFNFLHTGKL